MSTEDHLSEGDDRPGPGPSAAAGRGRGRAVIAVALIALGALAVAVVLRSDRPSDGSGERTVGGPGEPGAEVAVTAGLDWRGGQTGGWAYQHPAGWRVSTGATCGDDRIVVLLSTADLDGCAAAGRTALPGHAVTFAAVVDTPERPARAGGPTQTTMVGPPPTVSTTVIELPDGDGSIRVMSGTTEGGAQGAVGRAVAWTMVSPRTGGGPPRGPAYGPGDRPLLEVLAEAQQAADFPVMLPRVVPRGFSVAGLVVVDTAEAQLIERSGGTVRGIRFCFGDRAHVRNATCGMSATPTTERTYAGQVWSCGEVPVPPAVSCRRVAADGSWTAFSVDWGSFSQAELEAMVGSLSTDLDGAAWVE